MTYLGDTDPEAALAPLQAAACTYRIAFGPRAGQKVLTLRTLLSQAAPPTSERCVNAQGFSLHAEVRLASNQRHKLEHHAKLRAEIIPSAPVNANDKLADHGDARLPSTQARIRWAQLLKRVFDIDIEHCPHCGGTLKIIAAILNPTAIAKILTHLGASARAPRRRPARVIRSPRNGLIPNRHPSHPVPLPEPIPLFSPHPLRDAKMPRKWALRGDVIAVIAR